MAVYPGRRKKGTWRVVIWAKNRPHESIVEGSKKDALAFEARERVRLEAGRRSQKRGVPTFGSFISEKYQGHAEQHHAKSWRTYQQYQVHSLLVHFGECRLTEIDVDRVEAFKAARVKEVQASSVNAELQLLRTILNWAETAGVPVAKVKIKRLPERGSGRVRVWTEEQLEKLFATARKIDSELLPIMVFLINTGCRKGEAIACEWSWVDFDAGMIRIPVNEFWQPKSRKPREVPLSASLRQVLERRREDDGCVFHTRSGGRFSEFPDKRFMKVRDAAGLTGGPHNFRHTFASLFLRARPDLFLLSQILGHSHGRTTELYSHLLPDHLDRARDAVNVSIGLSSARRRGATKTMAKAMAG